MTGHKPIILSLPISASTDHEDPVSPYWLIMHIFKSDYPSVVMLGDYETIEGPNLKRGDVICGYTSSMFDDNVAKQFAQSQAALYFPSNCEADRKAIDFQTFIDAMTVLAEVSDKEERQKLSTTPGTFDDLLADAKYLNQVYPKGASRHETFYGDICGADGKTLYYGEGNPKFKVELEISGAESFSFSNFDIAQRILRSEIWVRDYQYQDFRDIDREITAAQRFANDREMSFSLKERGKTNEAILEYAVPRFGSGNAISTEDMLEAYIPVATSLHKAFFEFDQEAGKRYSQAIDDKVDRVMEILETL